MHVFMFYYRAAVCEFDTRENTRARANVHKLACVQIFMHAARMLNIKSISFVSGYGVHVDLYTGLNCLSFVSL